MSNSSIPKQKIGVDKFAAANLRINAARFKEWRRKMDRLERLGLVPDGRGDPPPRKMQFPPFGPRPPRSGNLSR